MQMQKNKMRLLTSCFNDVFFKALDEGPAFFLPLVSSAFMFFELWNNKIKLSN